MRSLDLLSLEINGWRRMNSFRRFKEFCSIYCDFISHMILLGAVTVIAIIFIYMLYYDTWHYS